MYKLFLNFIEFISRLISKVYVPFNKRKIKANNYREILKKIQKSDIILTKSNGFFSNLFIGEWTHVGMYCGDEIIIEANTQGGVVEKDLIDFLLSKDFLLVLRPKFLSSTMIPVEVAKMQLGKSYDYKFQDGAKSFYCSELVVYCYGYENLKPEKRFGSFTFIPDDFVKYKKFFEVVYEVKK